MKRILFIAGDVSGDVHCAMLAREVSRRHPSWQLHALGGPRLQSAGCSLVGNTSGMGVIGFASALAAVPRALRLRQQVLAWLRASPPDAVVLCDWGAFNARLLPVLRERKLRTLYYFPPRSWQQKGSGGLGIAPLVDVVATPFEWSARRLREAGCDAHWVGHPLLEVVRSTPGREELRASLGVEPGQVLVALLPGSRDMELRLIGPSMNEAALAARLSGARWVAAVPRGAVEKARKYLPDAEVREGGATELLKACDAALVKSGTSTLEAAVANAPQVVCYDLPPLLRAQWNLTLKKKVRFVAMPNIIAGRALVPEMLGDECNGPTLARELNALLESPQRQREMRHGYEEVRRALGEQLPLGATARTADLLEELVQEPPPARTA
jgi:lipid-A-disaccharide synthase